MLPTQSRPGVRTPEDEIWGTYNRISDAAREKKRGTDESGVGRQAADTRQAVAGLSGVVSKVYMEDDTSAFKKKRIRRFDPDTGKERFVYRVIRPVWQEALQDLRDGVISALMVDDLDRMARDMRDLEDAIEVVEHFNGKIVGVKADVNLTTDNGRMAARLGVAMANKSSADTRRRVTRKHLALSTEGGVVGGPRPFGWGKDDDKESKTSGEDRLKLHPVESQHLRRWIGKSLQGASWSELILDAQEHGVTGTRGRPIIKSSLRQILFSARNCGYRMFHGKLALGLDGEPVKGLWEPVCTVDEWMELTSNRIVPRSQPSTGFPRAAKYLLTGFARCGVCGTRMRGVRRRPNGKNMDSYVCPPVAEGGHQCVARNMAEVDRHVTAAIMAASVKRSLKPSTTILGWDKQNALAEAEKRRRTYVKERALGEMRDEDYFYSLDIVDAQIKELRQSQAAWHRSHNKQMLASTPWDMKSWEKLTINEKRAAMSSFMVAVEIRRVEGNSNAPFDPTKLKIIWLREDEEPESL